MWNKNTFGSQALVLKLDLKWVDGRATLNNCLPGRHHSLIPPGWSSCSSEPSSEICQDGHTERNNSVNTAARTFEVYYRMGPQSLTCYHDCGVCRVFRWTTGQPVILWHGSSIFNSLHTHEGWRGAQSDGLLQLELQKCKTHPPKSVSLFHKLNINTNICVCEHTFYVFAFNVQNHH